MMIRNGYSDKSGNTINASESCKIGDATATFNDKNSRVNIGPRSNISGSTFNLGTNSTLTIGEDCKFSGTITVGAYSSVTIGNRLSVTRNMSIRAVEATNVAIGNDCLIATDVILRTTDGHPIYDRDSRERLNASQDIVIKDHVWLADQSIILKGVTCGPSSVVAIRSVVTRDVPPYSIVAGIPAKVIRDNVVWEHTHGVYSEEYYNLKQSTK